MLYLLTHHAIFFGILTVSQYFQTGESVCDDAWNDILYAAYAMTAHKGSQVSAYQISVFISHQYTLNNED